MSDAQEESDLLAGHPPAVKAGGMRIVQHKQPDKSDSHQSREEKQEQAEEFGTVDVSADKHHQSILLSGAVTKGDKDFPPEAVKSYHQKPLPTHENRPVQKPNIIQQPR